MVFLSHKPLVAQQQYYFGRLPMRKFHIFLFSAVLALTVCLNNTAFATVTLFFEDFESYAPETELMDGAPGWFRLPGSNPTGVLYVRNGQGLSSQVADGYTYPGFGTQVVAMHQFNVPGNVSQMSLSADAYAYSFSSASGVRSHNFNLYLTNNDASTVFGWTWATSGDANCSGGWHFNGNTLGVPTPSKCYNAPNAVDSAVNLEVLIDFQNSTVQGRINHSGTTPFETDVFSVAPSLLADLGYFHSYTAYQGDHDYNGGEFDNLLVTAELTQSVPEPMSLVLLIAGIIGSVTARKFRQSKQG